MNDLLALLTEDRPTQEEILRMIAPAYAEVDCNTGRYTGYRYNYANEAFEPKDALFSGDVWYKGTYPINRHPKGKSADYRPQSKTKCIIA